jgi:hypothetical protein
MKTHILASAIVLTCSLGVSAMAAMSGGTAGSQGAIFTGQTTAKAEPIYEGGPQRFGFGAYYFDQRRDMSGGSIPGDQEWKVQHLMGYVGYDVLPWLTVEAGVGQSKLDIEEEGGGEEDVEWMAGAQVRLLDHMALDPVVGEDAYWVGLDGQIHYAGTTFERDFGGDIDWHELFGAITVSFTARPEVSGFVNRVGLYFGPAFSMISADQDGEDADEDQSFGLIGGLTVNPSDNVSLKIEVQGFGNASLGAAVGFHF